MAASRITHEERSEFPIDAPDVKGEARLKGVTLLVPVYNEEHAIEGVVRRLAALDLGLPVELLVVDDGSSDGTRAVLAGLESELGSLWVIEHSENRGYGAALKTGFAAAGHEVVVILDADGTYPEDRIPDLLSKIEEGAQMVVGARTGQDVNVPLIRRPAKAVLRTLASYLAGRRIPDLNSGLRAVRRELVKEFRSILPEGFSFTTTITLAALTNGHRVEYVSVNYAARKGYSKIRPIRDTLGFAALIVRTVLYFRPLKVFYPAAALIGLSFLALLYYDLFVAHDLGDKTVLMFVALVQVLTIGLLADLIEKKSRL